MLVNGTRADDLAGRGLTTLQRWVVPLWLSILTRTLGLFGRFVWRTSAWLVVRPLLGVPLVLLLVGFLELGGRGFWIALSLVMLASGAWLGLWPSSFDRLVMQRARGWWRWVSHYRRVWYPALEGCGLARITPDRKVFVPKVRKVTSTRWIDTLHVRLLHGHTPEDLAKQSECAASSRPRSARSCRPSRSRTSRTCRTCTPFPLAAQSSGRCAPSSSPE